jgi:hypothetical protein
MPLPRDWHGAFYGPGLMDDFLIDWEPPQYVAMLAEHTGRDLAGFIFLIGGAYFDLYLHDMQERAEKVLTAAEGISPQVPWNFFRTRTPELLDYYREHAAGAESPAAVAIRSRMRSVSQTIALAVARIAENPGPDSQSVRDQLAKLNSPEPGPADGGH